MKKLLFGIVLFLNFVAKAQDFSNEIINGDNIKTVVCYGYSSNDNFLTRINNTPIINLNSGGNIILEFDDLNADYSQYRVQIIHCDADWQRSSLLDLEYLNDYNEFVINDYSVSEGTKVPYYHYAYKIPPLKVSGNYVVQVYKNRIGEDLLIQKKFRICDPKVNIIATVAHAQDPAIWTTHQQIYLDLDLSNYFIAFPKNELRVFIRQNQRDDKSIELNNNAIATVGASKLRFNYFKNENTFEAGNEFRFVDVTQSFASNVNVLKTTKGQDMNMIEVYSQKSNAKKGYLNSMDNNGNFVISNNLNNSPDVNADYVDVKFSFLSDELPDNQNIAVYGKFNNWDIENGKMNFNPDNLKYEKNVILKNGYYDFCFTKIQNNKTDDAFFEGDFSDTENDYEIFVYQKAPGFKTYQLIGYNELKYNITKR